MNHGRKHKKTTEAASSSQANTWQSLYYLGGNLVRGCSWKQICNGGSHATSDMQNYIMFALGFQEDYLKRITLLTV